MSLTAHGKKILVKAQQTLKSHQEPLEEASRIKGSLTGKLRLGAGDGIAAEALGHLLLELSKRHKSVDVVVQHGTSSEILTALLNGTLDAGFYKESGLPDPKLKTTEVANFGIYLAAPPGLVDRSNGIDWKALKKLPWICPTSSTCCGRAADALFQSQQIKPEKIISIDREAVTRTLIAGGVGLGLLHVNTAHEAEQKGEVELICKTETAVSVLFAYQESCQDDPVLKAANSILPVPSL
ncbi:MAG: substrate-binding domain-containing protein [Sneathiella sp.]